METLDPLILARAQFGANITFHILFPTITIALGWVLLFFKLRYNKTKDDQWMDAYPGSKSKCNTSYDRLVLLWRDDTDTSAALRGMRSSYF